MYKNIAIIISFLLFVSCQANKSRDIATEGTETETSVTSSVDLLLNNPNIKIGNLQNKSYKQKVKATGAVNIPPTDLMSVHSKISGTIVYMKHLPGDYVKNGALLFKVSSPSLLEQQRILLETKEDLWLADKDFERKQSLMDQNAVTIKIYDEAKARKNYLQSRFTGLKQELQLIGVNLEKLLNENQFQSSIPIYASTSGYVQDVYINNGQMVQAETKLMDLANDSHVHLELKVLAKDVPYLKVGQNVTFTLPKMSKPLHAELVKLNPVLDQETGTLEVHCHIDKDDCDYIIPGMFVNAEIEVEDRQVKGLALNAVVKEGEDYYAFIIAGSEVIKTKLHHFEILDDFIVIEDIEADKMVISGAYYVE